MCIRTGKYIRERGSVRVGLHVVPFLWELELFWSRKKMYVYVGLSVWNSFFVHVSNDRTRCCTVWFGVTWHSGVPKNLRRGGLEYRTNIDLRLRRINLAIFCLISGLFSPFFIAHGVGLSPPSPPLGTLVTWHLIWNGNQGKSWGKQHAFLRLKGHSDW